MCQDAPHKLDRRIRHDIALSSPCPIVVVEVLKFCYKVLERELMALIEVMTKVQIIAHIFIRRNLWES